MFHTGLLILLGLFINLSVAIVAFELVLGRIIFFVILANGRSLWKSAALCMFAGVLVGSYIGYVFIPLSVWQSLIVAMITLGGMSLVPWPRSPLWRNRNARQK